MVHHLVIGIIFLFWGVADVLRLELPGILGKRLKSASVEERRLWQRLLGVLELIVGGGQLLFFFFSDNQTVTNIILAVMILAPSASSGRTATGGSRKKRTHRNESREETVWGLGIMKS